MRPLSAAGAPTLFGATVTLRLNGALVGLRTLDGGSGYQSQNGYDAHFAGLQAATKYTVEVRVPGDSSPLTRHSR